MNESKINKGILIFIGVLVGLLVAIGFSVVFRNKQKSIQQPVQKLAQESFEAPITTPTISESTPKKPLEVIDYYYNLLSSKKLKEAYEMHISPSVNYAQFEKWYKDDIFISPHTWNAIEISKNTYKFSVNLLGEYGKERGFYNTAEEYEIVMRVEGNKIQTLSSKKISGSTARFGQLYAYVKKNLDLDSFPHALMLEQNGIVKKIDEGFIGYVYFSPNGNYLIYKGLNESAPDPTYIYDISKQKKALDVWSLQWSEFTPDEKYFMACAYTEMDPVAYGSIYQLPDFKLKYELLADPKVNPLPYNDPKGTYMSMGNYNCRYDNDKNAVRFTIKGMYDKEGNWNNDAKKEVEYFLNTGKITYF